MAKYKINDGVCVLSSRTKSIADNAFKDCTELRSIVIPNSVTKIGNNAFKGCTGLTSITIPDSVTEIGCSAFEKSGLTSIVIPNGVTDIRESAFQDCKALTCVVIPESVTCLTNHLFSGCTALKEISLPDTMTQIMLGVFRDCTSLESITIPKSIESFGLDYMFMYSGSFAPVIDNPFRGCTALKSIYMTQKVFDEIEERAKSKKGPVLDEDMKKLIVIINNSKAMKTVNLTISCRRDYMAVFPVDDKQYKALKNRIKKDGEVNVDEACKKLGRATPLNREHAIEHGLIVAESEPFVRAEIDGIIVFENNVEMTAAVSNPFEYEFVNVDENVSAAFIGEMKNDGFESDEEDDYTISNYLTNNLERIKIESVGYDMEDGQQVLVIYYGGFSENGTLNFDFEIEDNEEFDVNKLHFFRACIEDQCGGLNCSAVAEDFEIFLEDMILYDKKVIGIRDVDIEDYGESETALGEYYPCDCINYE